MKIISSKEMARLDRDCSVPVDIIMERAGRGLADFIDQYFPEYPVCFVCGSGNNGGDGFVAARYLNRTDRNVEVFLAGSRDKLKELPRIQLAKTDVEVKEINDPVILEEALKRKKIVVDCIAGTGFKPPLKSEWKDILEIINKKSKITISCDIPTGINGDTGEADEFSADADVTVTFEYPKIGHVLKDGAIFTGSLEVVNIGIDLSPQEYLQDIELISRQDCSDYFSRRKKRSHKKDFGHILVIGGSPGMEGAPAMAALGALKSGAGLVTCGIGKSACTIVSGYTMSSMRLPLEETERGYLSAANTEKILDFIERRNIDSVVIGPGISVEKESAELVRTLVERIDKPVVLDADGINVLAGYTEIIKKRKFPTVLTPHPGEMSRLGNISSKDIQNNREEYIKDLSNELNCIVLLKGYRSLVSDGNEIYVNSTGNPGMATGGTGDVLSGLIGSLIGQGFGIMDAVRTGCWVHGFSGDIASWKSSCRYMTPEDILENLSRI